ncbi:MACPF domain-containing protein NSL1-like isoform X1 [Chenopodium quinoa]|uniref:MACPF domain-containing protein n=2 Tax=Chenopodium quinoa TaxID=63459 RepID=A0A803LLL2_CHEQI|nr:MACPF domain-containing protein NSL1-like isoform X1 [Chenopodium quinoa]
MGSMRNMDPQSIAEMAVRVIGYGYDLTTDLRLTSCKAGPSDSRLIEIDHSLTRDLVLPGGIVVPNVPSSIKSDKGERTRFRSDVLSFNQMSERFNQDHSLSGKIPSGHFNVMFSFKGCWQKDAGVTKTLAYDGCFITLYTIELGKSLITLSEDIKREVPLSWDPAALAAFIEKYGTHIVVGVKMGGKDVIHIKQLKSSPLEPAEVQNVLKKLADERFSEDLQTPKAHGKPKDKMRTNWQLQASLAQSFRPSVTSHSKNEDLLSIAVRRGGVDIGNHKQWVSTIAESPNVISMSFVPITSLLSGVQGCGFLSHAVNLYLRYKPPIDDLAEFLEYQLPRQWAPAYGDLPLSLRRKKDASPSLPYALMGPKLYVNVVPVDTGNRPVTGIRLFLEGKKSDRLAIHLQHLSALPKIIQLSDDHTSQHSDQHLEKDYIEPIKWSMFSHVYTAPVEHNHLSTDDTAPIVTKAWFEVKPVGMKKVLFLRLGFSMVASAKIRRSEWDESTTLSRKSGMFSKISGRFSGGLTPQPEPQKPDINSGLYPGGPPAPASTPKLSSIVDSKEMVRGPEDHPGYWVVTGAKLCMQGRKISMKAKFSLLTMITDSEDSMSM